MRVSARSAIAAAIVIVLVASGCAGQGSGEGGQAPTTARELAASRATAGTCRKILASFLGSMNALRRKLAVGLTYGQYLSELQAARRAYGAIPAGRVRLGCLLVAGTPAERALDIYIASANSWGECLTTVACGADSIEAKLQRSWAHASRLLSAAQASL
jgi:hypothetical protein